VACGDGDDRWNGDGDGGSSAGDGGEPTRGGTNSSGLGNNAGDAGAVMVAGADMGGAGPDVGGSPAMGGVGAGGSDAGMGGVADGMDGGMGGMGGAPECATKADCDDLNLCTDDACTNGQCQHSNNTADCDDLSSCTTGQDKCQAGACAGTLDTTLCPACNVPNNLVQNCDFSNGLTSWAPAIAFQGGEATQMVVNGRNVIDIAAGGEAIYSVQPRQEPIALKQGMHYRLRMVAGASVNRDIVMAVTQAAGDYKVYSTGDNAAGGFTLSLQRQMKPFEFEFTMVDPDDANVKLEIKMGGSAGNPSVVYIDDVALEEVACTDNPSCDDGNACTADVCDVGEGTCSWTPTSGACADDGDSCTADQCQAGECVHTFDSAVCDCSTDAQCDDNNACTDDNCNAGACENTANTGSCNDNDVCTTGDVCGAGVCGGANVCFDCTAGGNLLTNCDFSAGQSGWQEGFFGGTGTQSVVDGRLVVNITDGGAENWRVQPKQGGLVLTQNTTYVVQFNAMASVARTVDVSLTQDGGAYASYSGLRTFALTPAMQAYSFEFTMTSPPPTETVRLELNLGGTLQNATVPNSVTFDNMFIAPKL
jgi:Carbohydrate binding domain